MRFSLRENLSDQVNFNPPVQKLSKIQSPELVHKSAPVLL